MNEVTGSIVKFSCTENEKVTIEIIEKNTNWLVSHAPKSVGTMFNQVLTIDVGTSNKAVTLTFDFSSNSGGSYDLIFNGSADDNQFLRNISQTVSIGPEDRTYFFLVS